MKFIFSNVVALWNISIPLVLKIDWQIDKDPFFWPSSKQISHAWPKGIYKFSPLSFFIISAKALPCRLYVKARCHKSILFQSWSSQSCEIWHQFFRLLQTDGRISYFSGVLQHHHRQPPLGLFVVAECTILFTAVSQNVFHDWILENPLHF